MVYVVCAKTISFVTQFNVTNNKDIYVSQYNIYIVGYIYLTNGTTSFAASSPITVRSCESK